MIKLITLDLDNTLWDVTPVLLRAEKHLQQWIARELPEASEYYQRENLATLRSGFIAERPEIARLPTTLRKAILKACFEQAGLGGATLEEAVENAFATFHTARNQIEFFPETRPLLETLAAQFRLIALSNGNADVRLIGLDDVFDAHFSAESVGKPKPDPAMFEAALKHAGVSAQQAVHVGDHPEEDIEAAQQLGYRTIWFNPSRSPWQKTRRPDREVNHLNQLVSTIQELRD
ncbi:MAG: HAD family hydrolase [Ketobacteraceae bacterium]|nr:HAD family hydrolase [Ketobacteraceae bacterium]